MQHASGKDYDPSEWAKQRQERIKRALQVRAGLVGFIASWSRCSARERKSGMRDTVVGYSWYYSLALYTSVTAVHCCTYIEVATNAVNLHNFTLLS